MLQTIREYTQGWIATIIIGLIIISFAIWGVHSYFVGGGNQTVADINGVEISQTQLRAAYEKVRRQIQLQYGQNSALLANDSAKLRDMTLRNLINTEVLRQAAVDQGFRITDLQVDQYLQSIPAFQANGQFSVEKFQAVLSANLLSTNEFLDLVRSSLLIEQPKSGVILSAFMTPHEVQQTADLLSQERDIGFVLLPNAYFADKPAAVTPEQIKNYYNQHKKQFMSAEQVSVEYIILTLNDVKKQIPVNDAALKAFYAENTAAFKQEKAWKIQSIDIPFANKSNPDATKALADKVIGQFHQNIPYEKIVSSYNSTFNGKDWVTVEQLPAEAREVIIAASSPIILSPIKTAKGYSVYKVIAVRAEQGTTYETAKPAVLAAYTKQQAEEKFAERREQLANLTYEHPNSLQAAAKELGLSIQTTAPFTQANAGKDITQYQNVRNMAFSKELRSTQNNSDVIEVNPETAVVLRIKSYEPAKLQSLSSVEAQIRQTLQKENATAQNEKLAQDVLMQLRANTPVQALKIPNGYSWTRTNFVGRYNTKYNAAVIDKAFRLPNPQLMKSKTSYDLIKTPEGYAVVGVFAVRNGTLDTKELQSITEQGSEGLGLLEYMLYEHSQLEKAKVKTYN